MVSNVSSIASTDLDATYYLHNQTWYPREEPVRILGKNPIGLWVNPTGMFGLADKDCVTTADFLCLYRGFAPTDGSKLSRNAGRSTRSAGLDIRFEADKSVSALWAVANPELRAHIERAHNDAALESFERWILAESAYTRRRHPLGHLEVVPADIIAAMFQRRQSRERDPHLHTVIVCFNVARAHDDRKYRGHHQYPAYRWLKTLGAWYRAALAWNLRERLTISMEQHGKNKQFTRIAGMPDALVRLWSKRTRAIRDSATKAGVPDHRSPRFHQHATPNTRSTNLKHNPRATFGNPGDDHRRWRREASGLGIDIDALIAALVRDGNDRSSPQPHALLNTLRNLALDLSPLHTVQSLPTIAATVANRCAGAIPIPVIDASLSRVLRDPALIELPPRSTINAAAGLSHTRYFRVRSRPLTPQTLEALALLEPRSTGHATPRQTTQPSRPTPAPKPGGP